MNDEVLNSGCFGNDLYFFSNDKTGQLLLAAVYDNLGKGASGAALQNLERMLAGL